MTRAAKAGATRRCLECLREPCRCAEYPGMKIPDEDLEDMATSASWRGLRLRAEIVLRQRWPSKKFSRRQP